MEHATCSFKACTSVIRRLVLLSRHCHHRGHRGLIIDGRHQQHHRHRHRHLRWYSSITSSHDHSESIVPVPVPPVDSVDSVTAVINKDRAWFEGDALLGKSSVKFKCTACGKCCTGKGGKVWVNSAEQVEITELLDISRTELIKSYLVRNEKGKYMLQQKIITTKPNTKSNTKPSSSHALLQHDDDDEHQQQQQQQEERCTFLTSENKCSIYQARPTQCRTFPYWPHIMASNYDWQRSQEHCEGIQLASEDANNRVPTTPISTRTIWNNLLIHTVHRGGIEDIQEEEDEDQDEGSTMTYTQMMESLPYLEATMLQEFRHDYLEQYQREVVYESKDLWVVDTIGSSWQPQDHQSQQQPFQPTRSLIFRKAPSLTQSEMALIRIHSSKDGDGDDVHTTITPNTMTTGSPLWQVDHTTLLLDVHQVMARIVQAWDVQVQLLSSSNNNSKSTETIRSQQFAILGTGAGALPLWLQKTFPEATIDCVEASSEVLQVAQDYFGFDTSTASTLRSYCQRGEDYLTTIAMEDADYSSGPASLDLLVIDVAAGMDIPPRSFFEEGVLKGIQNLLVPQYGMVIWNVRVSPASEAFEWEQMMASLHNAFPCVHVEPVSSTNAANWIVYASNHANFLHDPIY